MTEKRCPKCKIVKPRENFPGKRKCYCSGCMKIIRKEYRKRNPEKNKEYHKKYRDKNYLKFSEYQKKIREKNKRENPFFYNSYQLKTYGLTLDKYNELIKNQEGRCAICGTNEFGKTGICIDHNHISGEVRGLLCQNCNTMLGMAKADMGGVLLQKAIEYIKG